MQEHFSIEILKLSTMYLLLFCSVFLETSCKKEIQKEELDNEQMDWEWSDTVEGYICGTFLCLELDSNGIGNNNLGERGFCILLEGSENTGSIYWPLDFYTFDIPLDLFDFPKEMKYYNGETCGPYFFPESLINEYKVSFQYREAEKSEKIYFGCGNCNFVEATFRWKYYTQMKINDLKKAN